MATSSRHIPAADVCLLLRAHAEARWLGNELVPLLRELEYGGPSPDDHAMDLSYLEVLWIEACARARDTESARSQLDARSDEDHALYGKARRYHARVRRLRARIGERVERLLSTPAAAHRLRSAGPAGGL
jgi:hypothetical protein